MQSPPICDVAAIRALEERALGRAADATPLMELAGAAAAGQARLLAPRTAEPVVVFAGPGNNGGDAFVVARHLREWGYPVTVVFDADPLRLPADARKACDRWLAAGGHTIANPSALADCALVVDGLFGIGLSRALTGVHAEWIAAINRSGVRVLALDIPSGLDADSGVIHGPVIEAAHTATFIALKPGLVTGSGVDVAGDITVHDLGLDARSVACGRYVEWSDARLWVRRRKCNTHKGSFGTLAIVGGALGMSGASLLAGRAALYTGAGKVLIGLIGDSSLTLDVAQPELMLRHADDIFRAEFTVLVVGPGLGQSRTAADTLARAISRPVPLVLDADALNLLALEPALAQRVRNRTQPTLVTPHPAEAARLLQTSTGVVQQDRLGAARQISERLNAAVALKGAGTVCVFPNGAWSINGSGNPGLATAGTGDVLAGILGSLVAQGYDSERAMMLAVCAHGAAADTLVQHGTGPIGLSASELIPAVRALLNTTNPNDRV